MHACLESKYSTDVLRLLPRGIRIIFAKSPHENYILRRRYLVLAERQSRSATDFQAGLDNVKALRCISESASAFAAYPTSEHDMNVNHFLWRTVQENSFLASEAVDLFEKNVFCVCVPDALYAFLREVSWDQLEDALLFVVSTSAFGEDIGMTVLQDELEYSFLKKVKAYAVGRASQHNRGPPCVFASLMDDVMDRIHSLGSWSLPTTLAYLSASDMGFIDDAISRQIRSAGIYPKLPKCSEKIHSLNQVMWQLYRDWIAYERVLCKDGGYSTQAGLDVMARVLAAGNHESTWNAVQAVLACARLSVPLELTRISASLASNDLSLLGNHEGTRPNLLPTVPRDVVFGFLIPSLISSFSTEISQVHREDNHILAIDDVVDIDVDGDIEFDQEEGTDSHISEGNMDPCLDLDGLASISPWSLKFMLLDNPLMMQYYNRAKECERDAKS